jgi:hypothetical protein
MCHGERCICLEAERFGAQTAAVVGALAASGVMFEYDSIPRGSIETTPMSISSSEATVEAGYLLPALP